MQTILYKGLKYSSTVDKVFILGQTNAGSIPAFIEINNVRGSEKILLCMCFNKRF